MVAISGEKRRTDLTYVITNHCECREIVQPSYKHDPKGTYTFLGVIKPAKTFINWYPWLWNNNVQIKVRGKKRLYYKFLDNEILANCLIYKNSNGKQRKQSLLLERLIRKNRERDLCQIVKIRCQCIQDIKHMR